MITKLTEYEFINAFDEMGRGNQFSRDARKALFEYYEELEEEIGEPIEFDCIAICCDWSEHKTPWHWSKDYHTKEQHVEQFGNSLFNGDNERNEAILEHLGDNTQVIEFNGGILVLAF